VKKNAGISQDEEFKLFFGMLISMGSFAKQFATNESTQVVNNFRTSYYKMNYMETITGLRIILNSDPDSVGISELLRTIYSIFVETVLKNPFVDTTKKIQSELFCSRVDEAVRSHHCYT